MRVLGRRGGRLDRFCTAGAVGLTIFPSPAFTIISEYFYYLSKRRWHWLIGNLIKINSYMQVFRKKYIFNPQNPIFESEQVQTYNCMNTETKDNKLIIIRHLGQAPFVQPAPGVLQPLQNPTLSQPFSVYPLVYCCSQIGRLNQADSMYVLKCLLQGKIKNPLYCILSPQGICVSQVEGLLPNRSPSIFQIAIDMLGIPASLAEEEDSVLSKEAYQIARGIRDGQNVSGLLGGYGWVNAKKEKDVQKDDQFWIFKGKRKEESPFGEDYSLAWFNKFGLVKFKYIDLSKDGYEEEFFQDYLRKIDFYRNNEEKKVNTLQIFKFTRDSKGIKLFLEILNQGQLSEYLSRRHLQNKTLTEKTAIPMLQNFVSTMRALTEAKEIGNSHGSIHSKMLYVHNHRIVLGEPLLVTDKVEKKLRELKTTFDYYAPEMKQNIILPERLFKLDFVKMDVWAFGFILHKVITRELPTFDPTRKPILNQRLLSPGMQDLIMRCLSISPAARPDWSEINLRELEVAVVIEDVEEAPPQKEIIRLGTSKEASHKTESRVGKRYQSIKEEEVIDVSEEKGKLMPAVEEEEVVIPIPVELSLRLKRIKLIVKIIIIMVLYVFVFFRQFLGGSIDILLVRSYYGTTSLNLVDSSGNTLSTTVIITNNPNYFLLNDISFSDVQNVYHCINNQFDPIYNPNYSLLTYVQSPSFLALLLTGWLAIILICVTKALSMWKGGISNRPNKNLAKYLVVYGFHQLSLASLLYAHFFIYQFFYFASGTPCFSIQAFAGIEPYFDSSLYLFLSNSNGYMQQVFSSLGVLAILVLLSSCYYAWGPKLDQKYFLSVPSIIFRIIPYILIILICRIGVFALFAPSAINDSTNVLPALISGSANGFFGIVPQIFVIICVSVEVLLELFFYWCERKAADSDKLSRLFNVRQKKVSTLEDSNAQLNDMSLVKSTSKIANDEFFS